MGDPSLEPSGSGGRLKLLTCFIPCRPLGRVVGEALVHRGPVVTAIDTSFGSSMRVRHACDSLRQHKYEARLSAGITVGWLGLVCSSELTATTLRG